MKKLNAIRRSEDLKCNYEWSNKRLQKGHVYVVINDNYTATVRNLKEFLNLLEKENTTGELEIVSSVAVTESFLYGVQSIIEQYNTQNNPQYLVH